MKQVDELGCPSLWLGMGEIFQNACIAYIVYMPPQMEELVNDSIFTSCVVSKMVNKIGIELSVPWNTAYFFCLAII